MDGANIGSITLESEKIVFQKYNAFGGRVPFNFPGDSQCVFTVHLCLFNILDFIFITEQINFVQKLLITDAHRHRD